MGIKDDYFFRAMYGAGPNYSPTPSFIHCGQRMAEIVDPSTGEVLTHVCQVCKGRAIKRSAMPLVVDCSIVVGDLTTCPILKTWRTNT
jgi:hypothetical protein